MFAIHETTEANAISSFCEKICLAATSRSKRHHSSWSCARFCRSSFLWSNISSIRNKLQCVGDPRNSFETGTARCMASVEAFRGRGRVGGRCLVRSDSGSCAGRVATGENRPSVLLCPLRTAATRTSRDAKHRTRHTRFGGFFETRTKETAPAQGVAPVARN
jgi:hypothetical protein